MSVVMLRRRKLGRGSCKGIKSFSTKIDSVVRNDKPFPVDTSLVIRWGTTSNTSCRNVVNTAEAIHRVGDKAGFRKVLMNDYETQRRLRDTAKPLCPTTIFDGDDSPLEDHPYPLVVRPQTHSQGRNVHLVRTALEMALATQQCGAGWYASPFINKVSEYRVTFVQGRVCWVAKKTPGNPQDVAWNVARGGRFDNVRFDEWPLKAIRVSLEAFLLSGLDFGAVDVMIDAEGRPYVIEINSAPSQTSPYRQACMAKCFDYLIEHGKGLLPVTEERGGWKKFVHPAISPDAIMV
jgi:glutathione synthase/RimK-type ligase-like ATP-grasp enzyme